MIGRGHIVRQASVKRQNSGGSCHEEENDYIGKEVELVLTKDSNETDRR